MPKEYWVNVYGSTPVYGNLKSSSRQLSDHNALLYSGGAKRIYRIHVKMKEVKPIVKPIKYNWRYEKFDWMG